MACITLFIMHSCLFQLRIRDLENALDIEKTQKTETMGSVEKLTNQLR